MLDMTLMQRVYWDQNAVARDLVKATAHKLVPALKAAIEKEAGKICKRYHMKDDPFANDAAQRLLLTEIAEYLVLDYIENPLEIVEMHQLTPRHFMAAMGDVEKI